MNTEKEDNCELCLVSQDKRMTANQKSGQQQILFAPHDAPVNTDMPTLEQKRREISV